MYYRYSFRAYIYHLPDTDTAIHFTELNIFVKAQLNTAFSVTPSFMSLSSILLFYVVSGLYSMFSWISDLSRNLDITKASIV